MPCVQFLDVAILLVPIRYASFEHSDITATGLLHWFSSQFHHLLHGLQSSEFESCHESHEKYFSPTHFQYIPLGYRTLATAVQPLWVDFHPYQSIGLRHNQITGLKMEKIR